MGPRNGNPRTALQLVSSIACASSLGGLVLLAEERRRRVTFAQKIIENGKKLQAYKAYQTAAPIEIFDLGDAWDARLPNLPSLPNDVVRTRDDQFVTLRPERRQLSNREWRSRRRTHRPIPTASSSSTRIPSSHINRPLPFEHWDLGDVHRDHISAPQQDQILPETLFESESYEGRYNPSSELDAVEETLGPSGTVDNIPPLNTRLMEESPRISLEADTVPEISVPEERFTQNEYLQSKFAMHLEKVVAERVISCINVNEDRWIRRGLKELTSYFQTPHTVVGPRMREAITLARQKSLQLPSPKLQKRVASILSPRIKDGATTSSNFATNVNEGHAYVDQVASASRLSSHLLSNQVYEAFFVFLALCDGIREPLHDNTRTTIQQLIRAFQDLRLFSVVNDIRQKCLFVLKEWRFMVEDYEWMLKYEPNRTTAQYFASIFKEILGMDLGDQDRYKTLHIFIDCLRWLERNLSLNVAIATHVECLRGASADVRRRLTNQTMYFLRKVQKNSTNNQIQDLEECLETETKELGDAGNHLKLPLANPDRRNSSTTSLHFEDRGDEYRAAALNMVASTASPLPSPETFSNEEPLASHKESVTFHGPSNSEHMADMFTLALKDQDAALCNKLVKAIDVPNNMESSAETSLLDLFVDRLMSFLSVREPLPTLDWELKKLTRYLMDIASKQRNVGGLVKLFKLARESSLDLDSHLETVVGELYADSHFLSITSILDQVTDTTTMSAECQAMIIHASKRDDTIGLLEDLQSSALNLASLPTPALEQIVDLKTLTVNSEVSNALIELLRRHLESADFDKALVLCRQKHRLVKLAGPTAMGLAYTAFANAGPISETVDFINAYPTISGLWTSRGMQHMHRKLLLRCWTSTRNLELTKTIFRKQISLSHPTALSVGVFNVILRACVEGRDLAAAQTFANEMTVEFGLSPNIETWSYLLLAMARDGDWDLVEDRLRSLISQEIVKREDSPIMDRVFAEFCRKHSGSEALEFCVRIIDTYNLDVTDVVARCVLDVVVHEEQEYLLKKWTTYLMRKSVKGTFSHGAFTKTVHRLVQSNRFKFDESLTSLSYDEFSRVTSHSGQADFLNAVINQVRRRDAEPQNFAFLHVSEIKQSDRIVQRTMSSRDISRQTERQMLDAIAKSNAEQALTIYKGSLKNGLPQSQVNLDLAIHAATKLPMSESEKTALALELISSASNAGLNVHSATTSLTIAKLRGSASNITKSEAMKILQKYYSNVQSDREISYTHLPIALAQKLLETKSPREALQVMKYANARMQSAGKEFDLPAWTMILRILAKLEDFRGIRAVVNEVLKRKLRVDSRIVRTLQNSRPRHHKEEGGVVVTGQPEQELAAVLDWGIDVLKQRRMEQREDTIQFARGASRIMVQHQREAFANGLTARPRSERAGRDRIAV